MAATPFIVGTPPAGSSGPVNFARPAPRFAPLTPLAAGSQPSAVVVQSPAAQDYGTGGAPPDQAWNTTLGMSIAHVFDLTDTAKRAEDIQLNCAALDALLPIVYGEQYVGGMIGNALINGSGWVFWVIWGEGTIGAITKLEINNESLSSLRDPNGLVPSATNYLGNENVVDAALYTAFYENSGHRTFYDQTCFGLAYSVIQVPAAAITSPPTFTAVVQGCKVYDPRDPAQVQGNPITYKWSDNPSLILGDYLSNAIWGAGLTVDWQSVAACADANDVMLEDGSRCRRANMVIDKEAYVDSWIETLRTAASCFIVRNQDYVKLIPDIDGRTPVKIYDPLTKRAKPGTWAFDQRTRQWVATATPLADDRAYVASYSHAAGQIIELSQPALRSAAGLPTVVEVQYTDTSKQPWQTTTCAPAMRPGVSDGSVPYRKSSVPMMWITTQAQATREAIERLNKLWMRSATFTLNIFDEGLQHEPGDLIEVIYPEAGFDQSSPPRLWRVIAVTPTDQGWALLVERHDVYAYSNVVQAEPDVPNTNFASPDNPPLVTGLRADEDIYLDPNDVYLEPGKRVINYTQTGQWLSRFRITWDDMRTNFPFVQGYRIKVAQGGVLRSSATVHANDQLYITGALTENLTYVISVEVLSVTGVYGDPAIVTVTNNGKQKLPSAVPWIKGTELGGTVYLEWGAATDRDLTAYEIRYSPPIRYGGSWALKTDTPPGYATFLDRVIASSLSYNANTVPEGSWIFWIKALDSIRSPEFPFGQYSEEVLRDSQGNIIQDNYVAYTKDVIVVTSDKRYFFANNQPLTSPILLNMNVDANGEYTTSNANDTWGSLFGALPLGSFALPLCTYHTLCTSALITAYQDLNGLVTGSWVINPTVVNYDGVASVAMQLSVGGEATVNIATASNTNPIVITTTAPHSYISGNEIAISGVLANNAANGRFQITVIDATSFSLQTLFGVNVAGTGSGVSGAASRWVWSNFWTWPANAAARFGRLFVSTTGTMAVRSLGQLICSVVTRHDSGIIKAALSGPAIVSLNSPFSKAASIIVGAQTVIVNNLATRMTAVYDAVEVSAGRGLAKVGGYCRRFYAAGSYVTLPATGGYQLGRTGTCTIECWFKADATTPALCALVNKLLWTSGAKGWRLILSSRYLQWMITENYLHDNQAQTITSTRTVCDGLWHHVAVVFLAGSIMKLYLDGVLDRQATVQTPTVNPDDAVVPLRFGSNSAQFPGNFFDGLLDDVRIWNVERSADDILASYHGDDENGAQELTGIEPGLVGYWKMNETSGTQATDSALNQNHHGTYSGYSGAPIPKARPYDGFDVYVFDASGIQSDTYVSWQFDGV